jgi:branched-chain amino acid transport system substrate-binding protein
MAGIFAVIKKLNGNLDDGEKVVEAFKGLSLDGPRGAVMIDPATRDIIQDERALEVYKKPDGKLGLKVLGAVAQVKDQCKEQKVGRCAQ